MIITQGYGLFNLIVTQGYIETLVAPGCMSCKIYSGTRITTTLQVATKMTTSVGCNSTQESEEAFFH